MVLRKANTEVTGVEVDTSTIDMFEDQEPVQMEADTPQVTSTAVAAPQQTAVATPVAGRRVINAFDPLENVMPIDAVLDLGYKALPCITVDLGGFVLDGEVIGSSLTFKPISWNRRYMLTAGAEDSDEVAKKMLRISYDNETCIKTEESVKDVLDSMREAGYQKASSKAYIDLWGEITHIDGKEVPKAQEFDYEMVQLQLSPESVKNFKAFGLKLAFRQNSGAVADTTAVTVKANRGEFGGKRFGFCTFALG